MTETAERVWKGAEELVPMLVPVDSLIRHPNNPRRGQVALIAESLARFGQVRPVLSFGGQIVAGNHTYMAALELGWTHIAAVPNEFESPEEARAYLLADNRLPELGGYDQEQLLTLLQDFEDGGRWEGTGYGPDDLDDLRAQLDAIPTTAQEEFLGDFAATADELAARAERLQAGRTLSEVMLLLSPAQAPDFEAWTKILGKHYGGSGGVTDTVLRAVTDAAAREP